MERSGIRGSRGRQSPRISQELNPGYELPARRTRHETHTQRIGNQWLDSVTEVLLFVPSAILPTANVPDRNVLINHRVANAASIRIAKIIPFNLDPRLFRS